MRKIFLIAIFSFFTPFTLIASLISLQQVSKIKVQNPENRGIETILGVQSAEVYASNPSLGSISQSITADEARPIIIRQYLERHHSPIAPFAETIFQISQKYNLDYRLMVAIAQCESNLCKKIPEGSYNCWGFENGATRFQSWEQAFNQVAKTLKEGYIDKGLVTPEQIMPKYAPPSVEKGGPWAKCVNQFLGELE